MGNEQFEKRVDDLITRMRANCDQAGMRIEEVEDRVCEAEKLLMLTPLQVGNLMDDLILTLDARGLDETARCTKNARQAYDVDLRRLLDELTS